MMTKIKDIPPVHGEGAVDAWSMTMRLHFRVSYILPTLDYII